MTQGAKPLHPQVLWAQRKEHIFVTIAVQCPSPQLDVTADKISFSGTSEEKKAFACDIALFAEVEPEGLKRAATARHIALLIPKKDKEAEWWPRLTKDKAKHPCIKVDFEKWKDEDEVEANEGMDAGFGGGDFDLNSMMSQMGGMGERPDLGDFGDDAPDSDNEELPDLEDDEAAQDEGEPKPSTAAAADAAEASVTA